MGRRSAGCILEHEGSMRVRIRGGKGDTDQQAVYWNMGTRPAVTASVGHQLHL